MRLRNLFISLSVFFFIACFSLAYFAAWLDRAYPPGMNHWASVPTILLAFVMAIASFGFGIGASAVDNR